MNDVPAKPLLLEPVHADDHADIHLPRDKLAALLPQHLASRLDQVFPKLQPGEIDRLRRFGTVHQWQPGEVLFEAGKPGLGMLVLLRGRVTITRRNGLGLEEPVFEYVPGEFTADVAQLSGGPALVTARALGTVEAIVIDPPSLRALVIAEAEVGERIMRALILRRVVLIETHTGGPVLIAPQGGPGMVRLQGFLLRNGHPFTVLDPGSDSCARELMKLNVPAADELPLVVCPDGAILKNPTERELALRLGMLPSTRADHVYDVAIVGAGPAGLAAAVYAASEGLSVVVLDTSVIGGQAGASARIENYLGFPTGISGQALAGRAFVQAQKFGAQVAVPVSVERIECESAPLTLHIDSGESLAAKTIVVATGAKYRRPDIPDLPKYEGRGIYYWASPIEARLCLHEEVVLVGGGNSAGQGVVFLAAHAAHVHLLIRGSSLESSMSSYLVERIASLPNVTLHAETEIVAFEGGADGLSAVRWRNRATSVEETKPIRRIFLFVGAEPNTGWLKGCGVELDEKGFVITGSEPSSDRGMRLLRPVPDHRPAPLETAVCGVFAIGDARAGSTKRVAAAVGEGAAVVAQIHAWLAACAEQSVRA